MDSLNLQGGDIVIEIGPGHGELTGQLLKHPIKVVAVEKDHSLVSSLKENAKFLIPNAESTSNGEMPKLEIVNGDALTILPSLTRNSKLEIKNSDYKVVGNIPYYITGHLLRILSELGHKPKIITLLIQKEVAERIVAKPPNMNLLAAVTQSWSSPKIIARVGKKEFSPPPKVDSTVIRLTPRSLPCTEGAREAEYYKFLRALFKQPRKTILNNLAPTRDKEAIASKLKEINIDPNDRPQDISLENTIKMFGMLYN